MRLQTGNRPCGSSSNRPADLVITDIMIPEKDGLEIIVELREHWPGAKIIAISGGAREVRYAFLRHSDLMGVRRILSKPIGRDELVVEVASSSARRGIDQEIEGSRDLTIPAQSQA